MERAIEFKMWDTEKQEECSYPYYVADLEYAEKILEDDGIAFRQYVGVDDKNGDRMFEGDKVKYTRIVYTDCSREEIQKELDPVIGKLYYSGGVWLGIQFEDETGIVFTPHTISSEEFEVLA